MATCGLRFQLATGGNEQVSTELSRNDQLKLGAAAFAVILVGLFAFRFWMAPPQMGADEEVFTTVDALFTAVTTKDPVRLDDCWKRLQTYRDEKKLPASASNRLHKIIQQAKSGQWDASAHVLYDFMLAQRR